jgi:hypothetical protein
MDATNSLYVTHEYGCNAVYNLEGWNRGGSGIIQCSTHCTEIKYLHIFHGPLKKNFLIATMILMKFQLPFV